MRLTLTDSETERLVNALLNLIDVAISNRANESEINKLAGTKLFRHSMWIPEANHVWDLILRRVFEDIPWYDASFDDLRLMISLLRDNGNRLLIELRVPKVSENRGLWLKTKPESVWKLRWKTLVAAVAHTMDIREELQEFFDATLFPSDGCEARKVKAVIDDDSHWVKCECVLGLGRDIEEERGWHRGCRCHRQECIAAAHKGETFVCPNGAKAKNGPFARKRMEEALERWRNNQRFLRPSPDQDPDSSIYSGIHSAYSHLCGFSSLEWKFLKVAPWRLLESRDREEVFMLIGGLCNT